jgi:hypothetical protein
VLDKYNIEKMLQEALVENIKHSQVLAKQNEEMPKLNYDKESL